MTEQEISRIVVLVEFNTGAVHQVLSSREKKQLLIQMLTNDEGVLQVTAEIEPFEFQFKPHETPPQR